MHPHQIVLAGDLICDIGAELDSGDGNGALVFGNFEATEDANNINHRPLSAAFFAYIAIRR